MENIVKCFYFGNGGFYHSEGLGRHNIKNMKCRRKFRFWSWSVPHQLVGLRQIIYLSDPQFSHPETYSYLTDL